MIKIFWRTFPVLLLICALGMGAGVLAPAPGQAGQQDAALFQEALSRFGQWLHHGHYGPVWQPQQVNQGWRPYTNGRWVPTQEGYVFETDEPWGWATYHYGNWANTSDYGWVWVPGRTWYPPTVNWRTNDEYIGWSPVAPPDTASLGEYSSGMYAAEDYPQPMDLGAGSACMYQSSPLSWIFTPASNFLLGWGEPYSSSYSYAYANALASSQYIPTIYERTVYVNNYVSPSYAPKACYNWGPPATYINKVTNINIERDCRYKNLRLAHLRQALPPANLKTRHPAWREIMPASLASHRFTTRQVEPARIRPGEVNRPDAIAAPASLSRSRAGLDSRREGRQPFLGQRAQISPSSWETADATSNSQSDQRRRMISQTSGNQGGSPSGTGGRPRIWQRQSAPYQTVSATSPTESNEPTPPRMGEARRTGASLESQTPPQSLDRVQPRRRSWPPEVRRTASNTSRPQTVNTPANQVVRPNPLPAQQSPRWQQQEERRRQEQRLQQQRRSVEQQVQQDQQFRRQQQLEMARQQQETRLRQEQQRQQQMQGQIQQQRQQQMQIQQRQQQIRQQRQMAAPAPPPRQAPPPPQRQKKQENKNQP